MVVSLVAIGNSTAARIVGTHLDRDTIARKNTDIKLTHPAADRGKNDQAVIAFDTKHCVRKGFLHNSVEFELVALGFLTFASLVHAESGPSHLTL